MSEKREKIIFLLIGIVFLLLLINLVKSGNNNHLFYIRKNVEQTKDWDGSLPGQNQSIKAAESIEVMGYPPLTLSEENPNIPFINPSGNQAEMSFQVLDEEGNQLNETDLILPGQMYEWNAYEVLEDGENWIEIITNTYDNNTHAPLNGTTQTVIVYKTQ